VLAARSYLLTRPRMATEMYRPFTCVTPHLEVGPRRYRKCLRGPLAPLVSGILVLYIHISESQWYPMGNKVKKRMGRPPTGAKPILVKVRPTQLARLKAWVKTQPDKPTLPEALRRLADKALACEEARAT